MDLAPNLVLVGPMGAGKTSIGHALAARFALEFVDADRMLEQRTGLSVAGLFEREGEAGFRRRERELLAELLAGRDRVVATGGGAVLDADTRRRLRERGFVIHLEVSVERQLERLADDRSRPLLAGPDRAATLQAIAIARAPLYREVADLVFDTDGLDLATGGERLARAVAARWQRDGAVA